MKNFLSILKSQIWNISFFWQAIIILFFGGLIIILVTSATFWFSLNQDLGQIRGDEAQRQNNFDTKRIKSVLEQIKTRSMVPPVGIGPTSAA